MNKNIYSLVTVASYILLIIATQSFTNNGDLNKYVKKNKSVHNEYEINNINVNNNENFRYRSLSEHNTENDYNYGSNMVEEISRNTSSVDCDLFDCYNCLNCFNWLGYFKCFSIFKRDKKTSKPSNSNESIPKVTLLVTNIPHEFPVQNQKHHDFLLKLKKKFENHPSNKKKKKKKKYLKLKQSE
ncbi:fam-c protein [Plasmodium vinckei vinckei]|uniref:Fam-c protein n=1 Tax=Plasmodium vinckei vinckei TaxID=54757 RepID=A0A449BLU7_PLAVN|nr:fam-c protein [Plasmodium vinckei vinckei]VEV54402.1 fam-c protein [Plasmodium vinckei vinckei]